MSARILIIDQDPEALENYRQSLAPKSSTWTIITVQSEDEGLAEAQESPPDIAVASLSLNNGQGLKTLTKIADLAPLVHPFIAAEEFEKPKLKAALQGGCHFLPRLCPPEQLLLEFQRCLAIESWLENPVVKELFSQRHAFESLPPIYLRIVQALNSPHSTVDSIAEIIRSDIALSSKILETANSSFYGLQSDIADIPQAVATLGLESIKTMALAIQLFDRGGHTAEHRALVEELWHHSQAVASAARRICLFETKNLQEAEKAYSAGLLHDIGKLVLLDTGGDLYIEAQRLAREQSIPAWRAEIATLGCDHAETGAYLLARWGLPQSLCETAALHHRPANSSSTGFSPLAAVHAANAIARKRKNPNHFDAKPSQEYLEEIGKAESWADWEAAAIGATPTSQSKPKPKLMTREPEPKPTESAAPAPHGALAHAVERAAIREEERERLLNPNAPAKSTFLAFGAGILFCLGCIYFLSSLGNVEADTEDVPTLGLASENSSAHQPAHSPTTSRSNLLEEILEINQALPPSAEAKIEPIEAPPPPPPPFPEIKLGAIFFQSTGPKAQINGQILSIGDRIGEARIVTIERTSITIAHYGSVETFNLD